MTGAGNRLSSAKRRPEEGGGRERDKEREREWDVKNYYIIARAKEHVRAHVATRTHVHTHT